MEILWPTVLWLIYTDRASDSDSKSDGYIRRLGLPVQILIITVTIFGQIFVPGLQSESVSGNVNSPLLMIIYCIVETPSPGWWSSVDSGTTLEWWRLRSWYRLTIHAERSGAWMTIWSRWATHIMTERRRSRWTITCIWRAGCIHTRRAVTIPWAKPTAVLIQDVPYLMPCGGLTQSS